MKPRLAKVITSAKEINPDVLVFYHSCGYIFLETNQLLEVGVDILNPIQPECMNFNEIYDQYGDRVSFWGTLGTQELLPFGTPQEVYDIAVSRLKKCGSKGGMVLGPTHMVEPEVPWENLVAIAKAAKGFKA